MWYIEKQLEEIKNTLAYNTRGRDKMFEEQLLKWGFHDGHTWGLDYHLAELILPRLKRYKELADSAIVIDFPLDDMIRAFELITKDDCFFKLTDEEWSDINKGLSAFAEHYFRLWW